VKHYEASATIAAPPERIWSVITDAANIATWDSGVVRIEGRIAPGEKIKVTSGANPKRAFPVKVVEFEPNKKMAWKGGMPLGLFTGMRTYTLTPGPGGTHFKMREEYTGPMTPLIWKSIPDLGPSFEQYVNGLKRKVEGSA
jgi:hypothetical protein